MIHSDTHRYDQDNFVCRKLQSDDPQDAADSKRKRGKAKKASLVGSPSKRFRGALEDRTCPQCNRVFTSQLGLAYHVSEFCGR